MSLISFLLLLARLVTVRAEVTYIVDGRPAVTVAEATIVVRTGDVTGDGRVTIGDAMLILRWVLEGAGYPDIQRLDADYNSNGRADIGDAVLCMRKALGVQT